MALAEVLTEKGLPAHLLAERSVLGAVLLDGLAFSYAAEILHDSDFHLDTHRRIFKAMSVLSESNRAIDIVTLGDQLERDGQLEAVGGQEFLFALTEGLPRSINIEHYARIVKDRSILRQLLSASQSISAQCLSGGSSAAALDEAQRQIFAIADERVQQGLSSVGEITPDLLHRLDKMHGQEITGLRTGYRDFDQITAGLHAADLVIIAARPSMGKTALAMNIAENVALREHKTVAVFSLEMSKVQLVLRMLCSTARVNNHRLRLGFLDRDNIESLTDAAARLSEAPIFIDDTSAIDLLELRAKCRRLKAERKALDLVVIDYLQLMGTEANKKAENRNLEISAISRGLKALAKELQAPVIALSQLSRAPEQRPGRSREPMLSDLRESGSIEQDADLVAFIYRDEMYNRDSEHKGVADIIIAKQRNGPTDRIRLAFLHQYTRFENLAKEEAGKADYTQ